MRDKRIIKNVAIVVRCSFLVVKLIERSIDRGKKKRRMIMSVAL